VKAVVVRAPGSAQGLRLEETPCPQPSGGRVLVKVEAFGLNRLELYMRLGQLPVATYPRVPGVECVGTVREDPNGIFRFGQKVAALMGGMGTVFDGSYAQFVCVRATHVIPLTTDLPWATLAALPQSYLTARGALVDTLGIRYGQSLLVRGGTSAVGMAAIALARDRGVTVLATTRDPAKVDRLRQAGVEHVVLDDGQIAERVRRIVVGGVDAVLELIGSPTMADSLRSCAPGGKVCAAGVLGGVWDPPKLRRLAYLLEHVELTSYSAETLDRATVGSTLQEIVVGVGRGRFPPNVDTVYDLGDIVRAHQQMEAARACGKLVVALN
jgi:NADPH:quinone reductase-like Zn-dependent oxidoreductase